MDSPSVPELIEAYRAACIEMDSMRLAQDRGARRWNRCVHRVQRAQRELRKSENGRQAITRMIDDPVPTVAGWAAAHALFWSESRARQYLEAEAAGAGIGSFDAKWTLREFDAGRLSHDWVPPKHD